MWSVGCIFGELILNSPLLPGASEIQELSLIATLLGSPTPAVWPNLRKLPLYSKFNLPVNLPNTLRSKFPHATENTLNLLQGFLAYDPEKRITVKKALEHQYFVEPPRKVEKQFMQTFPDQRQAGGPSGRVPAPAPPKPPGSAIKPISASANNTGITNAGAPSKEKNNTTSLSSYLKRRANATNEEGEKKVKH